MMTDIWAFSKNVPGNTCEDARLLGGGTNLQFPAGNDKGQAGWDIGLMFNNFGDLPEKLKGKPGPITRLAINVHGSPGKIDADSVGTVADSYDFPSLVKRYGTSLTAINNLLAAGAPVLIMGCNVAKGDVGASFISDMSKTAFPGHKVVAFTTIGETLRQYRSGGGCSEPGMRDTPYDNDSEGMPKVQEEREKEVLTLPWASENSPHAKVALNGQIIAGAEQSTPSTDMSPQAYLPGTWNVTIGGWNGYFIFTRDGTAYWTNAEGGSRHKGTWITTAGAVDWSFADDPDGWVRTFEVLTPLKTNLNGTVTVRGVPHGTFAMSKLD